MTGKENPISRHLLLSTVSFAICFALWGVVGAFGPIFREIYGLSGTQSALLVVVPVLLGSLARIPIGMHIDDLKSVLRKLGYDCSIEGPAKTWQALCPACKRKSIANA
jgi:hypothetical protein